MVAVQEELKTLIDEYHTAHRCLICALSLCAHAFEPHLTSDGASGALHSPAQHRFPISDVYYKMVSTLNVQMTSRSTTTGYVLYMSFISSGDAD
jgi:hypothetical protein